MNHASKLCSAAAALALAASVAPVSAVAQPMAAQHMNANARTDRSAAAIKLLASVAEGRTALRNNNRAMARTHINAALAQLPRIQGMALVPIYTEASSATLLDPVEAAKKGAAEPIAVRAVAGGYSSVLLDMNVARTRLNAASAALARGNMRAADADLRMIERGVVLERVATRMPLVKARKNLALAEAAVRRSNWTGAKVQLNAASAALADYSKIAPKAQMSDVNALQEQISSYAASASHADATARIQDWWNRVASMTDMRG